MSRRPEPRVDSAIAMAVRRGYLYTLGVLALGVVLLIWPEQAKMVSYYAAAAVVILIGLWRVIRYFREDPVTARERQLLATGAMRIILGGLMLLYATRVEKGGVLLQVICGAGLLVIGGIRLQAAFDLKRRGYAQWYLPLAVGAVSLILGVLCLIFSTLPHVTILAVALCLEALGDLLCRLKFGAIDRETRRRESASRVPPPPAEERPQDHPRRRVDWPAAPEGTPSAADSRLEEAVPDKLETSLNAPTAKSPESK